MLEFSKKSALVSRGFIGIKHDAVPRPVMNGCRQRELGRAYVSLSFTISIELVLIGNVTEACNKPLLLIAKEISSHVNSNSIHR